MSKTAATLHVLWLGLVLSCTAALAQSVGTSEASGTILDRDGNPVEGVTVTFTAKANRQNPYSGTTNKKGKYFVAGLFTPKEGDMWEVTVTSTDWVPVHFKIESRNASRVLAGDVLDAKMPLGSKVPDLVIRPLGYVIANFTVAPQAEMLQQVEQEEALTSAAAQQAAAAAAAEQQKSDAWFQALTAAQAGKLEEAAPLLAQAVEAAPTDAERRATQAKVLYSLERYEEAGTAAEKAIELDPSRVDVRKVLSSVQIDDGDTAAAKATLDAALALAPDDVDLLQRRAHVASLAGDNAGAISFYEKITQVKPSSVDAWLALAGLYARTGDSVRSEQAYQKVADLNPADAHQTFYNVGVVIMNRDDRNESDTQRAIDAFRKAVEIKPDYGQAYQQLAFALLGTGDKDGAVAALESFLKVAPAGPEADRVKGMLATLKKPK